MRYRVFSDKEISKKMTKDVLLRIQGLQFLQEENENPEPVEIITSGDYYKRNGKHRSVYNNPRK